MRSGAFQLPGRQALRDSGEFEVVVVVMVDVAEHATPHPKKNNGGTTAAWSGLPPAFLSEWYRKKLAHSGAGPQEASMGGTKHKGAQIAFALRQVETGTSVGEVCRFPGHRRIDRLHLAQEMWWSGGGGAAVVTATGRGEPQAGAAGGRPESGQGDAHVRVRNGYREIHVPLEREGWHLGHKRLYRLYSQTGLNLRMKDPDGRSVPLAGPRNRRPWPTIKRGRWISSRRNCTAAGGCAL